MMLPEPGGLRRTTAACRRRNRDVVTWQPRAALPDIGLSGGCVASGVSVRPMSGPDASPGAVCPCRQNGGTYERFAAI